MGKKNDAEEICRKYNVARDENRGKIFTLSELSTLLKGILPGLPTYSTTAQEFGLFEATKSGYKLPNDPVYIGRVENYLKEYRQKANELNKRSREKKAEMAASETPTNTQQSNHYLGGSVSECNSASLFARCQVLNLYKGN